MLVRVFKVNLHCVFSVGSSSSFVCTRRWPPSRSYLCWLLKVVLDDSFAVECGDQNARAEWRKALFSRRRAVCAGFLFLLQRYRLFSTFFSVRFGFCPFLLRPLFYLVLMFLFAFPFSCGFSKEFLNSGYWPVFHCCCMAKKLALSSSVRTFGFLIAHLPRLSAMMFS